MLKNNRLLWQGYRSLCNLGLLATIKADFIFVEKWIPEAIASTSLGRFRAPVLMVSF
ncbi:hypothetical protein [Undibacterium sp. Ji49W]|uniref:hypothetical protein n=1 Tax=Undibacterium sp. Ji49W TaxID=3413040 RepID=UPI003BF0D683